MFLAPEQTPYDLVFRLFGIPIRVHPFFWLFTALLGGNLLQIGFVPLLLWIVCVFVSILIHELGHALTFRRFGTPASIVLYSFGGLAIPLYPLPNRSQRIIVALAGPIAGFILLAFVYGTNEISPWAEKSKELSFIYWFLYQINLYWGLMNLLPVWPLDGGQVSRELCSKANPRRGLILSLKISMLVALFVAVFGILKSSRLLPPDVAKALSWLPGSLYTSILFAILAFESYNLLQHMKRYSGFTDDRMPWER